MRTSTLTRPAISSTRSNPGDLGPRDGVAAQDEVVQRATTSRNSSDERLAGRFSWLVFPHLDGHVLTNVSAHQRSVLAQVPFLGEHHGDGAIRCCHLVEAIAAQSQGGVQVIQPGANVNGGHHGNQGCRRDQRRGVGLTEDGNHQRNDVPLEVNDSTRSSALRTDWQSMVRDWMPATLRRTRTRRRAATPHAARITQLAGRARRTSPPRAEPPTARMPMRAIRNRQAASCSDCRCDHRQATHASSPAEVAPCQSINWGAPRRANVGARAEWEDGSMFTSPPPRGSWA